ncbi:MAG: hypothetical protein ABIG66_02735 [Candidatus Kerfeldbacteria bacterium]
MKEIIIWTLALHLVVFTACVDYVDELDDDTDAEVEDHTALIGNNFVQVSVGAYYACGLLEDGTVECWGDDSFGQREIPDMKFVQISAGGLHTCGVTVDGTIECWGINDDGQCDAPDGTDFIFVEASPCYNSCGVHADGTIECWGDNEDGMCDAPGGEFASVTCECHGCHAVREDGTLQSWGAIFPLPSSYAFDQVSAGTYYVLVLEEGGEVGCQGSGLYGVCDYPDTTYQQIAAGHHHGCGILTDGRTLCWGEDSFGEVFPPKDKDFIQLDTSYFYSCGLTTNSAVWCWGIDERPFD